MRTAILTPVLAALLAFPCPSWGGEASFGFRTEVVRDDNVFGAAKEDLLAEDGDWSLRVQPVLRVEEPDGDLQWSFEYRPRYEHFFEHHELRGWDHDVEGTLLWQISPRTSLSIEDRLRRFGLESRFNETTDVALGDDPVLETRQTRRRILQNRIGIELNHQLNARNVVTLAGNHLIYDRRDETRPDQENYGASLSHLYVLSPRTRIGPALGWSRRIQKPAFTQRTSTDFVNLSLRVVHQVDKTFVIDVSAGPALVLSDEIDRPTRGTALTYPGSTALDIRTCPTLSDGTPFLDETCEPLEFFENVTIESAPAAGAGLPQFLTLNGVSEADQIAAQRASVSTLNIVDDFDSVDDDVTYFADVTLRKAWENWLLAVGYRRSDDSSTSTFAVTSVSDRLFANLVWTPSQKLRITLAANWIRREQSQEIVEFATGLQSGSLFTDNRACAFLTTPPACFAAGFFTGRRLRFDNVAMASAIRGRKFDRDFDSILMTARLSASYRLRKRVFLRGSIRWTSDEVKGNLTRNREVERFLIRAGVEYQFEPWRF